MDHLTISTTPDCDPITKERGRWVDSTWYVTDRDGEGWQWTAILRVSHDPAKRAYRVVLTHSRVKLGVGMMIDNVSPHATVLLLAQDTKRFSRKQLRQIHTHALGLVRRRFADDDEDIHQFFPGYRAAAEPIQGVRPPAAVDVPRSLGPDGDHGDSLSPADDVTDGLGSALPAVDTAATAMRQNGHTLFRKATTSQSTQSPRVRTWPTVIAGRAEQLAVAARLGDDPSHWERFDGRAWVPLIGKRSDQAHTQARLTELTSSSNAGPVEPRPTVGGLHVYGRPCSAGTSCSATSPRSYSAASGARAPFRTVPCRSSYGA